MLYQSEEKKTKIVVIYRQIDYFIDGKLQDCSSNSNKSQNTTQHITNTKSQNTHNEVGEKHSIKKYINTHTHKLLYS